MRALRFIACLSLLSSAAMAQPTGGVPLGKLGDAARPTAYRLDLTILPDQPRFSGQAEIDTLIKAPSRRLYLHGRDLTVTKATAQIGGKAVKAVYTQVDKSGVVRLDFATPLPAGPTTLSFDYSAPFAEGPSGVYRIKVGDKWYSWSQFESIDARAAFPSFDEPGFKTPFTVSITTAPGLKTVSNAPEASVEKAGALERHRFQPTKPLPTYLLALMTGPFVDAQGSVSPTPERKSALPLGVFATAGQGGKLDYVQAETPRIVHLLESYFGQPFPFPKLDQIASPVMPGAMENAGADTYGDSIILLDAGATTRQKQAFGMIVAHELSHQWFGDLVTPAWWDDIWLNESFANWMGYRIGNEWRPELNIGVGAIDEGFLAMNTDSLEVGRPIHQPIATNSEIDSAFDSITYGKGGQVVAMIAAYMGDAKFKAGVRLHMSRHMYGNATSEQFFGALADAAHDPRILAAMRSFVDQRGVPVIDVARAGDKLVLTQTRYAFLGSKPASEQWTIPLCIRQGKARDCTLLDRPSATIAAPGKGAIIPNAGGTGYYRFTLSRPDWEALIAESASLPAGEAIATSDSLWASFRAGKADAAMLIAAARAMSANPDSNASVDGGDRLAGLRARGFIDAASLPGYHLVMASIYSPRLMSIGFDPRVGAHAGDDPDRQKLRQDLVSLVAGEAQDEATRIKLKAAGDAYLAGDTKALDQAFLSDALGVVVEEGGVPAAKALVDRALASEDAVFRNAALGAAAGSGRSDVARWLLDDLADKRLRSIERVGIVGGLASTADTRDLAADWILANYEKIASGNGVLVASRLPRSLSSQCSAERAAKISATLGPKVKQMGSGELDFARTIETIRHCAVLKQAKTAEIAAAFARR